MAGARIIIDHSGLLLLQFLLPYFLDSSSSVRTIQAQVISFQCEATNCIDCINEGCGWFPLGGEPDNPGECVTSCSIIADAPCYSEEYYSGQSPVSICNIVTQDEQDWNTCSTVTDCDDCVTTVKSDGTSNCVWYEISNNCGSGVCSLLGCGTSTCNRQSGVDTPTNVPVQPVAPTSGTITSPIEAPTSPVLIATAKPTTAPIVQNSGPDIENPTLFPVADTSPDIDPTTTSIRPSTIVPTPLQSTNTGVCDRLSTAGCEICISSGCGWISDATCLDSCSIIADVACYDSTTFSSTTTNVTEICTNAQADYNDHIVCNAQETCTDCLSTNLTNSQGQKCSWYQVDEDSTSVSRCCYFCDVPGTFTEVCSNEDDANRNETEVPTTTPIPTTTTVPASSSVPSLSSVPILAVDVPVPVPASSPSGSNNSDPTNDNNGTDAATTAAQQRTTSSSSSPSSLLLPYKKMSILASSTVLLSVVVGTAVLVWM